MTTQSADKARRIIIIGAGPGGMCAAIKLREAGYTNFSLIEKSGGVGGTWYNTRYPGLACDVRSHLYSFSFEPNPYWSRDYAAQPEILAYMERVADKYGLRPHLKLNTKVTGARWDEAERVWRVATSDGNSEDCDVLIAAQGMFNDLHWPEIEGLETFSGTTFHASRWNEDHDLTGRRVAVIGSAAAVVQFLPEIAPKVGHLHVFQRSAPWVLPKEDGPVSPDLKARYAADPAALLAVRESIARDLDAFITFSDQEALAAATQAGLKHLEVVKDPMVRAKLTPHVPFGCLRPLITNDYYPVFNRPNAELVTDAITKITPEGIVTADGATREVDTLICATGYHVQRYLAAIDVTGVGGVSLGEAWRGGAQAYLGMMTSGFPNLFMMYGPNTNNGSILFMLERQADFIVDHIALMDRESVAALDIRREVMDRYNAELQSDLAKVGVWQASCSNYYRTPEGRIVTQWPHTMVEYTQRCAVRDTTRFEMARAD